MRVSWGGKNSIVCTYIAREREEGRSRGAFGHSSFSWEGGWLRLAWRGNGGLRLVIEESWVAYFILFLLLLLNKGKRKGGL